MYSESDLDRMIEEDIHEECEYWNHIEDKMIEESVRKEEEY